MTIEQNIERNIKTWELRLYPYWFEAIASGKKTVEGRVWSPKYDYATIRPDDRIIFTNEESGAKIAVVVVRVTHYDNIVEYLRTTEGLENCLPGITSVEAGVEVYNNLAPNYKERALHGGIYAVKIRMVPFV